MSNFFSAGAIKAGLIAGTLDITAACIQTYIKVGKGPDAVLKYLASAVFGKDAYTSGAIMIFIGLVFHYIVAMSYTLFFFWLVQKFPTLLKTKILTAIVYSIFMWAFMEFAVLPLTKVPHRPIILTNALIAIGILVVCIGLPITYMASRKIT